MDEADGYKGEKNRKEREKGNRSNWVSSRK